MYNIKKKYKKVNYIGYRIIYCLLEFRQHFKIVQIKPIKVIGSDF